METKEEFTDADKEARNEFSATESSQPFNGHLEAVLTILYCFLMYALPHWRAGC